MNFPHATKLLAEKATSVRIKTIFCQPHKTFLCRVRSGLAFLFRSPSYHVACQQEQHDDEVLYALPVEEGRRELMPHDDIHHEEG